MIRIAAVGDIHFGPDLEGTLRPHLEELPSRADALLLAGDLTRAGQIEEGESLARELEGLDFPIAAVLGNHDYHCDEQEGITQMLTSVGVSVLSGGSMTVSTVDGSLGVAGVKGFGGGFAGACGTEFGEKIMKDFIGYTHTMADRLAHQLAQLGTDVKVALMHYSPIKSTLMGERLEIYPFLGSYLLAEAVDRAGADLVVHGHSHGGKEKGVTPGGIHVRNVAQPVIKKAYAIYEVDPIARGIKRSMRETTAQQESPAIRQRS